MISLIFYLCLGGLTFGLLIVWDQKVSEFTFSMPAENWLLGLLEKIVVRGIAGVLVITFWPIALFLQIREILAYRANPPSPSTPTRPWKVFKKFAITRNDLGEQLTVQEIEERERVIDPMGAVPDVPFGFLNSAWLRFMAKVKPRDFIWAFSKQWMNRNWQQEQRSGYVILRRKRIGPFFLATFRELPDED